MDETKILLFSNIISTLLAITIYIAIIGLLCSGVRNQIQNQNAVRIAIYIVITLIICWPVAIGQGIYVALKWNKTAKKKEQTAFRQAAEKVPQPESYEEFRARWLTEQEAEKRKAQESGEEKP